MKAAVSAPVPYRLSTDMVTYGRTLMGRASTEGIAYRGLRLSAFPLRSAYGGSSMAWVVPKETPTIMVAQRACTADSTISRAHLVVVAKDEDDHQEHEDHVRGALIKEESCVKTIAIDIVLGPHSREAWGAAILLLEGSLGT